MLSIVTAALSFSAPLSVAHTSSRASGVSMATMESSFIRGPRVPLGQTLGCTFNPNTGAPVKGLSGDEVSGKMGMPKPLERGLVYTPPKVGDMSPPCGVCYHDGSGTPAGGDTADRA